MTTWTRSGLKSWAKETMHRNYWRMVLVGFIMMIATGGLGGGSSSSISRLQNSINQSSGSSYITDGRKVDKEFNSAMNQLGGSMDKASMAVAGGVALVVLVMVLIAMVVGSVFSFFLIQPLIVGGRRFFSRSLVEDAQLGEITYGFTNNYLNVVKNMFLMNLFIGLWSLLFVIPGIVKSYEYRMIPYLLGEHPEMSTQELFQASRDMMNGQKWSAFVLDVSFIGWNILGAMTCGILYIFWVYPYIWLTNAALYRELSGIDRGYGPQGTPYGQGGGYTQGTPYGQSNTYTQGNSYGQNDAYNQGNPYGQNDAYNQGNTDSQNTPYGQGYYTQGDSYNQNSGNAAGDNYGQWQGGTQNNASGPDNNDTGNPY